jgi:geranylgeranyl pyrophosphate synthase
MNNSIITFTEQFNETYVSLVKQYAHDFFIEDLEPYREQVVAYALGGKRIRPYMCSILAGEESADAQHAGYALEIFHLMALVHDDIIDQSEKRRDVPTVHMLFDKKHPRLGEDLAILWGDYLFAQSMRQAKTLPAEAQEIIFDMYDRTVLGQVKDVLNTIKDVQDVSEQDVLDVHKSKTWWYTFIYPLHIGAALSGDFSPERRDLLTKIGSLLGQLFQVRDDILDMLPSSKKEQWKDLKAGTATWVLVWLRENDTEGYEKVMQFQKDASPENFEQAIEYLANKDWPAIFDDYMQKPKSELDELLQNAAVGSALQREQLQAIAEMVSRL